MKKQKCPVIIGSRSKYIMDLFYIKIQKKMRDWARTSKRLLLGGNPNPDKQKVYSEADLVNLRGTKPLCLVCHGLFCLVNSANHPKAIGAAKKSLCLKSPPGKKSGGLFC